MPEQATVDTSTNLVENEPQVVSNETAEYEAYRDNRNGLTVQPEKAPEPEPEPVVAQDADTKDEGEAEGSPEQIKRSGYARQKERIARLEAENQELKARVEKPKEPEAPEKVAAIGDKPKLEDFPSVEEWEEAKYEWRRAQEQAQQRLNAHQERVAKAREAHGEKFDEALDALSGIKVTTTTLDAIQASDIGPEVLMHLGENPKEAQRLSRMDPVAQLVEIGRLEAKLAPAQAAQTEKPAPKPVKQPPAPIKPLAGGKSVGTSATNWMESDDYEVYRAGRKRAAEAGL